jgi:hypothetical protein
VTARFWLSIGLAIAAVAVGGWRLLLPTTQGEADKVTDAAASVIDTITRAQFTGAQATLDAQRMATGSYAGAPIAAPMRLVRADATSYCLEYASGSIVRHLAGPGGVPQSGGC